MVLVKTCEIIALAAQCKFAPHSFLTLYEFVQFDAHGFEDQTVAARWTQDNVNTLEAESSQVVAFGCDVGGWAACRLACDMMH
jgi:carboxylesterase type B